MGGGGGASLVCWGEALGEIGVVWLYAGTTGGCNHLWLPFGEIVCHRKN